MTDAPWAGDACSLVDAFRAGERSPVEELDATLAAIEASSLNAFSFLDPDRARERAAAADVSLPFGGVPVGVKELNRVEGWPETDACLVFADRIADCTDTMLERLRGDGGANFVGLTTASEFGGLNVSISRSPWPYRALMRREKLRSGSPSKTSVSADASSLKCLAPMTNTPATARIPIKTITGWFRTIRS